MPSGRRRLSGRDKDKEYKDYNETTANVVEKVCEAYNPHKRSRTFDSHAAKEEIEYYGFHQDFSVRFSQQAFIVVALVVTVFLALVIELEDRLNNQQINVAQVPALVLAFAAFVIGFPQWRAVRHEISMDKFYDRLNVANQRLHEWPAARALYCNNLRLETDDQEAPQEKAEYERFMYVCMELDNLEYALEKYRLGYMKPELARRALRTFRDRCEKSRFRYQVRARLGIPHPEWDTLPDEGAVEANGTGGEGSCGLLIWYASSPVAAPASAGRPASASPPKGAGSSS